MQRQGDSDRDIGALVGQVPCDRTSRIISGCADSCYRCCSREQVRESSEADASRAQFPAKIDGSACVVARRCTRYGVRSSPVDNPAGAVWLLFYYSVQ